MTELTEAILLIIYCAWAVYAGLKFIKKKGWFAEAEKGLNELYIRKIIVAFIIGYIIGGFYLVIVILGLVGIIQRTW